MDKIKIIEKIHGIDLMIKLLHPCQFSGDHYIIEIDKLKNDREKLRKQLDELN